MKNMFGEVVKTRYAAVLREYIDAGFTADQFLVLPNSYYFDDPGGALRDIASHVGVTSVGLDSIKGAAHSNKGHASEAAKKRLVGDVPEGDAAALRGYLEPQLEGLRELHCEEGLKMAAWGGRTSVERERYWSFMPKGAKADCE